MAGSFFCSIRTVPIAAPAMPTSIGDYDIGGFDECLPTISACLYPEPPFAGVMMPDHGEVWALPWKYEIQGEELDFGS